MSRADRGQYAETVTSLSEGELRDVLSVAEPPVCLLGGWAVHLHVTEPFRERHGRAYIGSRDIDLGVYVDPELSPDELTESPVSATLNRIENELGYTRGRFGFFQQFHRETGDRLDEDDAADLPAHEVFRVDVIPNTERLDAFRNAFGFRPPAEPLLDAAFTGDGSEHLEPHVDWDASTDARIASATVLAAMKVRAFPRRDKSHKRLKDLADLHGLLWYVGDYDENASAVRARLDDDDVASFRATASDALYERAAALVDVDATLVRQSIEQLFA